jgi:hypothetical protein
MWDVLLRPTSVEETNQRNVLLDGFGIGLASGVGTFLSVLLVRLGASSFEVGLLTSLPALTGMIMAIPIGEYLSRQRNLVPWYSLSRFLYLTIYPLIGLILFIQSDHLPLLIISLWALATVPQTVVTVLFTVVMGAVAGPQGVMTLMSRRWFLLSLVQTLTIVLVGWLLDIFAFPVNYQLVFIGSFAGTLLSFWFSRDIRLPIRAQSVSRRSLGATLRDYSSTLRSSRRFVNFLSSQFVFRTGLSMAVPLFPIFWVRNALANDAQIGAINGAITLASLGAYFIWTRLSQVRGERWVLTVSSVAIAGYPLATALTTQVWQLVVVAALAGFFVAGVDLVFFDVALKTCPSDRQASFIGIYQTTVYVATFVGPMVGTTLLDSIGIVPTLMIASAIRLGGAVLMRLLKVGQE